MMGIRNLASAAAIATMVAAAPLHAQQSTARSFTLSGNWSLDAGDDYCRLAANFANGEDVIALALEKNRAENFSRLVLIGDVLRPYRGADAIGYSYMPSSEERSARYLRSETGEGLPYYNLGNITFGPDPMAAMEQGAPPADLAAPLYDRAAELEFAAGVRGIELASGLNEPVQIATGSMRGPMEALQACTDDLLLYWGLDYQKHQSMTRRATPAEPGHEWIATGTIGFEDFALLGGGNNAVRVMVDAQGKPTDCQIHWPSLTERKNRAICEGIMEKGRFEPALDADGNAMASYWTVDPIFGLVRPFGR